VAEDAVKHRDKSASAEEKTVLDAIEPYEPLPDLRPPKRSRSVGTGVGDFEHARAAPDGVRRGTGICAVSGCGEELSTVYGNSKYGPPVVCKGCYEYGAKKLRAAMPPDALRNGAKIYRSEVLRVLGVTMAERMPPTTGRSAAYAKGRGGWYGRERNDG
jgi:hypothetical protein